MSAKRTKLQGVVWAINRTVLAGVLAFGVGGLTWVPRCAADDLDHSSGIEPNAGTWRTWVISSGKDYRVAPPREAETRAELRELARLMTHNDAQVQQQINHWDAGAPAYRWMDLFNQRMLDGTPTPANSTRVYTYMAQAMYDATIAAWNSKYFYNRPRPSQLDKHCPL